MSRAPFQVLVIPYRRGQHGLEVAVLRRADADLWQFVSGGGEGAETPELAARREGHEEAGIDLDAPYLRLDTVTMIPACCFAAWTGWPDGLLVVPEHAFAVDLGDRPLVLSREHPEARWLGFDAAGARLRFDSNRTALWELHERLYPGPRRPRAPFGERHDRCACTRSANP